MHLDFVIPHFVFYIFTVLFVFLRIIYIGAVAGIPVLAPFFIIKLFPVNLFLIQVASILFFIPIQPINIADRFNFLFQL